jgi:hypothetical protein
MKSITVLAYNRPDYLRRTLAALAQCRGVDAYEIYVSVDDAANQTETLVAAHSFSGMSFAQDRFHVYAMEKREGVNEHPRVVYDSIFRFHVFDFNVCLEDDVIPSQDALELCDVFFEIHRMVSGGFHDGYSIRNPSDYACLLLHSGSKDQSDPLQLSEISRFCPWGWAMTRQAWENVFRPNWNPDTLHPPHSGWDYGCGLAIQRNGLKCLKPVLSRTLNIGREKGTYETPAHWDEWAKDLVSSDGTHGKHYFIGSRLTPGYEKDMEEWVKEAVV